MRTILFATVAASAFAIPAFAQVAPTPTGTPTTAQTGMPTTGTPSNAGMETPASSDPTSPSNLGLGGLLKQTQAGDPGSRPEKPDARRSLDTKAAVKKARGH